MMGGVDRNGETVCSVGRRVVGACVCVAGTCVLRS